MLPHVPANEPHHLRHRFQHFLGAEQRRRAGNVCTLKSLHMTTIWPATCLGQRSSDRVPRLGTPSRGRRGSRTRLDFLSPTTAWRTKPWHPPFHVTGPPSPYPTGNTRTV